MCEKTKREFDFSKRSSTLPCCWQPITTAFSRSDSARKHLPSSWWRNNVWIRICWHSPTDRLNSLFRRLVFISTRRSNYHLDWHATTAFSNGVTHLVSLLFYYITGRLHLLWLTYISGKCGTLTRLFLYVEKGNNWGICEDGTGAVGCGDYQETFVNCADIAIV